ncbi:TetR/AcrR family transcriptional regulator [Actinoplanes sp. NBRC 101535]|uniref:TetR/AcrR family transcriptional regulator n=1 Tax=Actinoplanes sp. NBRC 101535 TaxID=3032196 RepID=UPI0025543CA5|nr:TetR/AcrR family transcriptional regulator [Actinoplanes sp. NBRC 101535]
MAPRPPASERLDRTEVLAAALAIADTDGLDAVTLRRVATAFGVTPMALYWHFKDKDALLDALVERVLGEIDLSDGPSRGDGSDLGDGPELRAVMTAVLRVLRAHPALAEIMPIRLMRTPAGLDLGERVLGLLRADGHPPVAAAQLSILILTTLIGLVTNQPDDVAVPDPALRAKLLADKRAKLKSLPSQDYPHLTETADFFLEVPDEQDYYERGLTLLINGVRHG